MKCIFVHTNCVSDKLLYREAGDAQIPNHFRMLSRRHHHCGALVIKWELGDHVTARTIVSFLIDGDTIAGKETSFLDLDNSRSSFLVNRGRKDGRR